MLREFNNSISFQEWKTLIDGKSSTKDKKETKEKDEKKEDKDKVRAGLISLYFL